MRPTVVRQWAVMALGGFLGGCASAYGDATLSCAQIELAELSRDAPRTIEFFLDSAAAHRATTLEVTVVSGAPGQLTVELSGPESHSRVNGPVEGHRCEVGGAGLAGEWQLRVETDAPIRVLVHSRNGRLIADTEEVRPGTLPATLAWSGVR